MLNYKIYGEGQPFVILHGLFGMLDNWQTLGRQWAETYQVILVDLPNHGRSPHSDELDYDLMATAVAELLEALGHDEVYLLGHSMGGKVAMQIALTYPDLVRKLIVVDMTPRQYRRGHDDVFAALNSLDPATISDRKEAAKLMSEHVSNRGVQLFLLKNLTRDKKLGYKWRMNLPVIEAEYETLIGPVGDFGDCYDGPALFVRGGKSGYVRDKDMEYIQLLFPKAELVTVAGAGHWLHAEEPEVLFGLVGEFLG
ncbi:alpha/beta fold hydrolase [Neolewinella antarctica]|uniref:Pimeloyl-ACP methyl ester carboxylesterase n=1 Tax=Neolewinella antarctica TaxID=442734 RepID=A0ABX0XH92_9BACT|nr:alpha/beta fold hydrolase [Neolewinella antarctica]NJC28214.1 pimeloyl-ACP methyl ester carboxylesterase [Neolewinella antarctica]